MYPQLLIWALALKKRDRGIRDYALLLSVAGLAVAAYQYALQLGVMALTPCSTDALVSCSSTNFRDFGYVTIPMMSFTSFAYLSLISIIMKLKGSKRQGR